MILFDLDKINRTMVMIGKPYEPMPEQIGLTQSF